MLEFLDSYIGCTFAGILLWIVGSKMFKIKEKISIIKVIISILLVGLFSTLFNIYATDTLTSVIKIVLTYILSCAYYFYIFKVSTSKAITAGFLTYLSIIISDVILGIILAIISAIFNIDTTFLLQQEALSDLLVYFISLILILLNIKKYIYLVDNSNFNKKIVTIITVLVIITIGLLGFKIPLSEWKLSIDFIITMMTTLCFCVIGIYILKQKSDIRKTTLKYQKLVNYSEVNNKLLEDYRTVSHEHKNQLSIIRGMVNESNQEIIDYIDNLLEKRNVIKYQWISELNKLPMPGLKGLMNYKIMEMENEKLNISIMISKDISKTKLNKLTTKQKDDLYSIVGIYMDNAIQSAKESKTKEISLEIYKEQQKIILVLANSYKGKINLTKIDEYGYSTKGKKRGIGLHIVKTILNDSDIFAQERKVYEEYFVQELHINLKNIK